MGINSLSSQYIGNSYFVTLPKNSLNYTTLCDPLTAMMCFVSLEINFSLFSFNKPFNFVFPFFFFFFFFFFVSSIVVYNVYLYILITFMKTSSGSYCSPITISKHICVPQVLFAS